MFCRNCGTKLPDTAKFCFNCGESTPEKQGVICPSCSEQLPEGSKFCRACGAAIGAEPAPAASTSVNETSFAGVGSAAPNDNFVEEDEPTVLLSAPRVNQTAQPQSAPAQTAQQQIQSMQLPSFLTMGGAGENNAQQNTAPKPVAVPPPPVKKTVRKKKKGGGAVLLFFIILILLAAAAAALYFTMFSADARIEKLTEQAELFLDDKDYKGAAAAYEDCIIIGTQDPEIYLSLASAYMETDDSEKALEALKKGYAATGDEKIWQELTALEDELDSDKE